MEESKQELKSLLMRLKEESEKTGLKLNVQKTKIVASGPITSWQIDGEPMETVTDFLFMGSKVTAVGDCSHKIKRHLLLGRKSMTNLDSILKSREITFLTMSVQSKLWFFQQSCMNVRVGLTESWELKNWCFWVVVLERTLEQEYWSGLLYHSPRDLPNPGVEPGSPALKVDSLPAEPPSLVAINNRTGGLF